MEKEFSSHWELFQGIHYFRNCHFPIDEIWIKRDTEANDKSQVYEKTWGIVMQKTGWFNVCLRNFLDACDFSMFQKIIDLKTGRLRTVNGMSQIEHTQQLGWRKWSAFPLWRVLVSNEGFML